jgi:NADPH:quinone reductase
VKGWVAINLNGEAGLQLQELATPKCGSSQIRIANHAVALNFPDVLITRGSMTFAQAACFGMVHGTALHGLRQRGGLQPGETVLVLGSGGGCGSAAVGVAAAMGARVIAGASSPEKCAVADQLGADHVIDYAVDDLHERVMHLTDGAGVDVAFDPVGGALFDQARRCVGWNGRYLVVGFAAADIPVMPANYTILKSMALIGVAYGMSAIKDPAMNDANFSQLFAWHDQGHLRVHIGEVADFGELPRACARMYAGSAIGKTVVEIDPRTP